MPNERVILCGGAARGNTPFPGAETVELTWNVGKKNVRVEIEDIRKPLWRDVPAQFQDLIDIAAYVYCADQAVTRGGDGVDNMGQDWRRSFFFRIPVRKPDFWSDAATQQELVSLLSFLSEDEYQFDFVALKEGRPFQTYCPNFGENKPLGGSIEEVVLYSGGLDSVAGAIQEAITDKRRIVLVTHSPTDKLIKRQRELLFKLRQHSGQVPIEQIRVHVNKDEGLSREYTQRTRSFLYAALAATIARMLNLNRIRFYENGVVSFNLPLAAQVVGARATRTTHPRVLSGFGRLFSMVATSAFTVENLFLWKTKTEVVKLIVDAGCSDVIEHTTSCSHTRKITLEHPHCGVCSQCIDRQFATLGAGAAAADPAHYYAVDLFTGAREKSIDRTMLASYVETTSEIAHMDELGFLSRYGEVSRILRHVPCTPEAAASKVFELHLRHAKQVGMVVDDGLSQYRTAIRERTLPATCLLRQVCETGTAIIVETQPAAAEMKQKGTMPTLKLKPNTHEVWADGNLVKLVRDKAVLFDLLMRLAEHPGELVKAQGKGSFSEPVKLVRRSFKKAGCPAFADLIENERGMGYRLNAKVQCTIVD